MSRKAVALLSGGLDSTLAAKLILLQGIELIGINFTTPFFQSDQAFKASKMIGVPLYVLDITEEHFKILRAPRYGYGRCMNPCIDCHALMIKKAGEFMREMDGSFIVTGEVLGERPKSQTRHALSIVEGENRGLVLRPLSAKLLDETIPEKEGWVKREELLGLSGRSRRPQMELAERLGIKDYPTPAGGCKLTDPGFSRRLKDYMQHKENFTLRDVELLKVGRHFRLKNGVKIVVGRNREENIKIKDLVEDGDILLRPKNHKGPTTLLIQDKTSLPLAATLTAYYTKGERVEIEWRRIGEEVGGVMKVGLDEIQEMKTLIEDIRI